VIREYSGTRGVKLANDLAPTMTSSV